MLVGNTHLTNVQRLMWMDIAKEIQVLLVQEDLFVIAWDPELEVLLSTLVTNLWSRLNYGW